MEEKRSALFKAKECTSVELQFLDQLPEGFYLHQVDCKVYHPRDLLFFVLLYHLGWVELDVVEEEPWQDLSQAEV